MVSNKDYYGNEKECAISYLEFGSIDLSQKKKSIWGYWQDQEAYDLYMFARYARDLFSFRHFLSEEESHNMRALQKCIKNSAHDKLLDYIFKYAGIVTAIGLGGVLCESGSSIYGLIEEAMACDTVFHNSEYLDHILHSKYLASDISAMMNEGAVVLHPNTEICISEAPTIERLIDDIENRFKFRLSMFYGLSVSIRYAVRSVKDLIRMTDVCDLQIYNRLSLSYGDTFSAVYGTGKTVYIISLPQLVEELEKIGAYAKYCTANMQKGRDGQHSVRVSLAISRNPETVEKFISEYEGCVGKAAAYEELEKGEWKELRTLKE